jgi:hypothetical protein
MKTVLDKSGALYGTTSGGGANDYGTVFNDLIIDKTGALYGTTSAAAPVALLVSGLRLYCTASRVPTETFPIN